MIVKEHGEARMSIVEKSNSKATKTILARVTESRSSHYIAERSRRSIPTLIVLRQDQDGIRADTQVG